MGTFFKSFLACLAALFIFGILAFVIIISIGIGSASSGGTASVNSNSLLVLDLSEGIKEQTLEGNFSFNGVGDGQLGLRDVQAALEKAKTDDKIKGIYLKLSYNMNGWSTAYELRNYLADFKKSKKFIYAYGNLADQKTLYLSSIADSTFVNPIGVVELKGLAATGTFYKKALDKLEVQPVVFYCGKFKGASEPYRLEKFSDPNKQQLSDLLRDFYGVFLTALSQKSGKDTAYIANLANTLAIKRVPDAVREHLIDGAAYEHEVLAKFRNRLGLKADGKIHTVALSDYLDANASSGKGDDAIAVLYAEGEIVDGEGDDGQVAATPMIKEIRKLAANDKIKAVVLRINSPGGSALASENMYQELMQLRKKKPIIVSMGDVAASGGYYLACAGDSIFAQPTTITGSIGVVGMLLNFQNFMSNKIGITTDVVKTAAHADFPNVTRTFTSEETAYIQNSLDSTYSLFKRRVADARHLSLAGVEDLAQGHVYSGTKGKQLQLVDAIGGIDQALASAAKLAKLQDYRVQYYPAVKDPVTSFMEKFQGKKSSDAVLKEALGPDYKIYQQLKALRSNTDKLQMRMPMEVEVR